MQMVHKGRTLRNHERRWVLVVLLIGVALTALVGFRGVFAQSQRVTGQPELKKGEYEKAIKLLTEQLASNTRDESAQKLLLRAHIETGRYTEAEAAARKFL